MREITPEDILNPEKFEEIARDIATDARQQLAQRLALDLKIPLPEDNEALAKAIDGRTLLLKAIEEYNDRIVEKKHPEVVNWSDIPEVGREWLLPNWLPANTMTMFTGDGGAGKSWLTLQAVCQIACGFEGAFLNPDFQPPRVADYDDSLLSMPKNIVFATYEDEPAEIKRRLLALASGMGWIEVSMEQIKQNLHIVDMRGIGSVWGPGMGKHIANTGDLLWAGKELRKICEEKAARLLVMDPLSGAFGSNENDRTAVYDFVSSFRRWADTTKCTVFAIGHLPKSTAARAAGFSGSTAWEASVRSLWKLGKKNLDAEKREYWVLEHMKSNYAPLQPQIFLAKNKSGWWTQAADKEAAADAYETYQNTIEKQEDTPDENGYDDLHGQSF